jgi:hypothetical protein
VEGIAALPSFWCNRAATLTSEVNNNGIACHDGGIVDKMRHESIFDGAFCGLAIGEHADVVAGDVEIIQEPAPHFEGVIDTRRQIPNFAGFILVNPDNESENGGRHPTECDQ